ncbi:AAA family ATPase [Sphingomonas rubra]|uniref:Predicted ATPase n=1 Tax=Sphingomonas rubra TaxID=634430 RepID=A0A1I5RAX6_9SPHN|nr:AAA family ATPase [Sphingomonas rubra]SFP55694.1 Predicted ATPase [Sphingomonas rubra]
MPADRLHIVTGGPGSGKTTLIDALTAAGVATSPEVGRRIIREQIAVGGDALPWGDERAFARLMIEGEIAAHVGALARGAAVVLDRGVPDVIGFLRVSGLTVPRDMAAAAEAYRYNRRVFLAPFWADIYRHDAERRQPPTLAERTEAIMRETYAACGYELVELPRVPVAERVAFVIRHLKEPA